MTSAKRLVNAEALKQRLKNVGRHLASLILCLLALVGGLQLLVGWTGETLVTPFRRLDQFRPDLLSIRTQCLTLNFNNAGSPAQHWKALQPTRDLLQAINPEIAMWLAELYRQNRFIWEPRPTLFNWPVIAAYDGRFNNFYLGPDFWKLPEGEKAAVIAHEYFHSRQNKLWIFADTIQEALSGQLSDYGSRTEDEAHFYQWYAYRALGMPSSEIVRNYFNHRKLYRFVLSQGTEIPGGKP